ncbi:MAG: ABC transporter ATP-binding protein [Caulobacteraceae bacterium]
MTCSIRLDGVTLDYYIYSVRAQSLRNAVFNMAVGGKLYKEQGDITVVRALENITFNLEEGDRLALIGHNGSGKTTLLKILAGIYLPSRGRADVKGNMTSMIALGAGLDLDATGLQNIRKMGAMRLIPNKVIDERMGQIVEFSGLGDFVRLPVKTYSQGMMARLMFACATEFEADVLVLDEWLAAGDADFIHKAKERMQSFVDRAKIVVMGTHSFDLAEQVCNKVCVLDAGHVAYFGPTEGWVARGRGLRVTEV